MFCRIGVVEQILGMWIYYLNLSLLYCLFETNVLVIAVWFAFCARDVLNARKFWDATCLPPVFSYFLHASFGVLYVTDSPVSYLIIITS